MTIRDACVELVRDPVRNILWRWNWKSAIVSAVLRGVLFFATNLAAGPSLARRASIVEFVLRLPLVGILAAVNQTFRRAEPAWATTLTATAVLPLVAHAAELIVHWTARTPALSLSMRASVTLSSVATIFTLFVMRRDVLIVGEESRPFSEDLMRLPALIGAFLLAPLSWMMKAAGR